jgi:SH3-like domain-containing protein
MSLRFPLFAFILGFLFLSTAIAQSNHSVCISANTATLRDGPSSKANVTWQVGKYTPFLYLERKGNWLQVQDLDGEKAWVHSSSVTQKWSCVIVRTSTASLRTGPGKDFALSEIPFADKYTPFKRGELQGDWYQVEDETGTTYWIQENKVWRPLRQLSVSF